MKLNKMIAPCLALCLVGSSAAFAEFKELPAIVASAEEAPTSGVLEGNVNFNFDVETGTLTIFGTGAEESIGEYPWNFYREQIKTVVIEEGITAITPWWFNACTELTSVTIPEGVQYIGMGAFVQCTSLKTVEIPSSVENIGELAFVGCIELNSVQFANGLKEIGVDSFRECSSLTSVVLPESLETIEDSAFEGCSNLTDVTILNPSCEIYDTARTISNAHDWETDVSAFYGTIHGVPNSTAQAYAEKYGYKFGIIGEAPTEDKISGDINGDGDLTVADVIEFSQKLLSRQAIPKDFDLNNDNVVNVIDLALLKRALLNK
ncbi:MAG: leucine-rich repeat protein [Oscillospiraceae bacterium]